MVNGNFDHFVELSTFQLDDLEKIFTNTATIVMTSKMLATSENQARKYGLRMKIDGKTKTNIMSIQAAMSNSTIFCSPKPYQK